eukprot:XP_028337749.1 transforming acidic coiled-coil-containing protein 2 [Physeter catodon]
MAAGRAAGPRARLSDCLSVPCALGGRGASGRAAAWAPRWLGRAATGPAHSWPGRRARRAPCASSWLSAGRPGAPRAGGGAWPGRRRRSPTHWPFVLQLCPSPSGSRAAPRPPRAVAAGKFASPAGPGRGDSARRAAAGLGNLSLSGALGQLRPRRKAAPCGPSAIAPDCSPVVDDVIQPAALEDPENPLLAAFSPHGDVSGWVSTDLTAQRYGGGGAHGGWRDPRAGSLRLPPALRPIFCPAVSPQDPTHTQVCSLSCTGLGLFLGPQELPEGAPERPPRPPTPVLYVK